MNGFTRDQKIAMLVVPLILFGMLGVSYAGAVGRTVGGDEESTARRAHVHGNSGKEQNSPLRNAIESEDYKAFVSALGSSPYYESATPEVFDTLVRMYALHMSGKHIEADAELRRALYKA